MKQGIIILSLILLPCLMANGETFKLPSAGNGPESARPVDSWTTFDKWQHFSFSLIITVQSGYLMSHDKRVYQKPDDTIKMYSAGISLSFGLLKEMMDSRSKPRGFFSWKDLVMDAGGTLAGVLILEAMHHD